MPVSAGNAIVIGSSRRPMHRFVTLTLVLLSAAACSGTDTSSPTGMPSAPPMQSPANQPATQEADVTTIRITIDDRPITAQLADNPTAQDLAGQLPLTLTFRDLNRVEKIAELPRPSQRRASPKATTQTSLTSATTHPPTTSSCTTATSAIGTASSGSADSTPTTSTSSEVSPTDSKSRSNRADRGRHGWLQCLDSCRGWSVVRADTHASGAEV
jgi:cyclophilin-like protein